ncbi:MAG TPA: MFS transporter [Steroidobacteraceae bacterium]|nr:MFS transporter [Steroidobacteraceae bacterium]
MTTQNSTDWRLPPAVAFPVLASVTVSFLASASAPTPLYPTYQAEWGFSPLAVTTIFGVYAIAVLVALLFFGRLSDHLGRKPVLLAAMFVQVLTMGLFASANGLGMLLLARVVQGLAAGVAIAAVGAGLLDLDKSRGAIANAITTPMGTATGGILSGVFVTLLPAPQQLIFLVLGAVMVAQGIGIAFMRETLVPRAGVLASLKPRFAFSDAIRAPLLRAAPAIVATWAAAGVFASLSPAMVRSLTGIPSPLLSGLAMFAMAGSGGVAVYVLRHLQPRRSMRFGVISLAAGVLLLVPALSLGLLSLFYIALSLAGVGFGSGFQGAVRSVVSSAKAHERAGVLSVVFVLAYLAMGLPAIGAGWLLAHGRSLPSTTLEFAALVLVLSVVAVLPDGSTRRSPVQGARITT